MTEVPEVAIARQWLGTPYVHQASIKGAGADCLGLVRGIWREMFGAEPEPPPAYTDDWAECDGDEILWQAAARHLVCVSGDAPLAAGQVLLFRMRKGAIAKHLGIVSADRPVARFIHAYSTHGVVESPLTQPWATRVAARFRFP